jgi:hypothetical protein
MALVAYRFPDDDELVALNAPAKTAFLEIGLLSRSCLANGVIDNEHDKRLLILFTESLDIGLAVRIEKFLAALLPRRFEFGGCDVPVRPAFLGNGTQVLAEIFESGPAPEPVAVVDLIDDETGLEDNHMGDHGIVGRIRIFGDVEIFLDDTPRV